MLVLRRRSQEAIVFEDGLSMTVAALVDRRAWLAFEGPEIAPGVTLAVLAAGPEDICLGIRSPASVKHAGAVTTVTVEPPEAGANLDDAVLLLRRRPGEVLQIGGLSMSVSVSPASEGYVAHLELTAPRLPGSVSITVFSASGAEARIGVQAPEALRVYRKEIWLQVRDANVAAAAWSLDDLAALSAAVPSRGWGREETASAGTADP
jgi:sRNA-binding carbon storage regulator CsrA